MGAGGLDGRALTPEAMHSALQVLSKFRRLAESHKVDEVIAVATSATREAENGGEFLQVVTQQTGIRPRVISGTEEARLIHLAAVYGVSVPGDVAVVIDIGGGSVEVTRGVGANVELGRSFKLGVIRLTERFVKTDPLETARRTQAGASHRRRNRQVPASGRSRRLRARHRHVGHHPQPRRRGVGGRRARARRIAPQPAVFGKAHPACAQGSRGARSRETAACAGPRTEARGSCRGRRHSPRRDSAAAGRQRDHAVRSVAARRAGARLHLEAPEGNRAGRSVPRRPPPERHRARRAMQLLARALAARRAPGDRSLRPDARDPRPHRPGARVARIRGDPARHRRAHQLRRTPQALVLPREERRSSRLRAGRNRSHRPRRPLSSSGDAETEARRLLRLAAAHPENRAHARGDPAAGREPRSQPRADDRRLRAPRSRRRRPAAVAHHGRRGAGALGRRPPCRAIRTTDGEAAPHRGQRPRIC